MDPIAKRHGRSNNLPTGRLVVRLFVRYLRGCVHLRFQTEAERAVARIDLEVKHQDELEVVGPAPESYGYPLRSGHADELREPV